MDRETGNQGTTTPEPHKIFHNPSYKHQQLDTYSVILLSDPQILWQAGGPVSQSKEGRRWRSTLSYGEGPCAFQRPVGISRGIAASKADSAPPMSHSSRALLGMYWLVQGQGCRVLRLPLYMTKRQLGAFFAIYIYTLYQILRHQL